MPTIQCSGKTDGKACLESFTTQEALHKDAKFTCKIHTGKAIDVERFQETQFDPTIGEGADPHHFENGSYPTVNIPRGSNRGTVNKRSERKSKSNLMLTKDVLTELNKNPNAKEILKITTSRVGDE